VEPALLEEQIRYLESNPHEKQLMEIFRLARIEWGRIDYSLLDGRIQVWEINTNPHIIRRPEKIKKEILPAYARFVELLRPAFSELAGRTNSEPRIPLLLRLPTSL
jgi:hypothetical protein